MIFRSEGLGIQDAAEALRAGQAVIYPTETLYALGVDPRNPEAVDLVYAMKGRSRDKALPLIIGEPKQLRIACNLALDVEAMIQPLIRAFWPGPLTILLPASDALRGTVAAEDGTVAVRFTANSVAQDLSRLAGLPLVATSANRSGETAPARVREIDQRLIDQSAGVVMDRPWPHGGPASTIVRLVSPGLMLMLRRGAVSPAALNNAGFEVL